MREPVSTGYLLARLTDTIADSGEIPLQSRTDALNRLAEHIETLNFDCDFAEFVPAVSHPGEQILLRSTSEVIERLASNTPENREAIRKVLGTIIEGQKWDLARFPNQNAKLSDEELLRYTWQVAGCVGEFWTEVGFLNLGSKFAAEEDRRLMLASGKKLGQGLQLINIIRDLHEDVPAGRHYLPDDDIRRWLSVCRDFLNDGKQYVGKVRHRKVKFATALPLYLAEATADRLEAAGEAEIRRKKIKVPRSTVWKMAIRAALFP